MALIAVRSSDGAEVESFSIDAPAWDHMRSEPLGTYRMPGIGLPAVLKRSIRGLQFFAHMPGDSPGTTEPMSEHHVLAQIAIVRALRNAGMPAGVERPGASPEGEKWQADVLCHAGARAIAFEIQLATQSLEEYETRTARYSRSGVEYVWLVQNPTRFKTLTRAIWLRAQRTDPQSLGSRAFLPHMATLPLELGDPQKPAARDMRVVVFPDGAVLPRRVGLEAFALGVVRGQLGFRDKEWRWRDV